MEYQALEGMEQETRERLSKLRVLAAAQNDSEMLWAIEAEINFLVAVRDELRRSNRVPPRLRDRSS